MTKEGGRYKSWKKRFMAIEGDDLNYYKKDNKKEKMGSIPIQSITEIEPTYYKSKKHCFLVATEPRTFYIVAPNEEEMNSWVTVLRKVAGLKQNPSPKEEKSVSLEDFHLMSVIGRGSYGKVMLVRKKDEPHKDKVFAMKILDKKTIIERQEVEHTKSEKSILMKLKFPFLCGLYYSFQSTDKLYFIMDYINGGELFFHLQKVKKFSLERVRFYTAEIVAGLEYLHSSGVIYRDLKPENLLLSADGHIVLTDFGLSKEGLFDRNDRTVTFCGTPEYLAPEVLEGKGYTRAVDWWSLGTLVYEMLTGLPPYYCEDIQQMYLKIMTAELDIPDKFDPYVGDLLSRLLERDVSLRLQDPEKIKRHPFFRGIDWNLLIEKKIPPPFVPEVSGVDDTSNIDVTFTNEEARVEEAGKVSKEQQTLFADFTYNGDPVSN
uniref:non-specific serine/threonine protein kinase n=1 Tax=Arcella intermedia TaxID=1963864 RepID=A0A6B2L4K5_9EUKA